jgi:hypothetical protein
MTLQVRSDVEKLQLPDVAEEAEHALHEQSRGALIVGGQAAASEQVQPPAG